MTERVSEKGTSGVVCPQVGCKETSGVIYTQETSGVVCTSGDRERATALAQQIRDQVRAELGFTVNVGISCNKLLAKMASDFEKPDRTHTLYPEEVPAKMWPLPIEALHGCGKSTAQKLQLTGQERFQRAHAVGGYRQGELPGGRRSCHLHALPESRGQAAEERSGRPNDHFSDQILGL